MSTDTRTDWLRELRAFCYVIRCTLQLLPQELRALMRGRRFVHHLHYDEQGRLMRMEGYEVDA